MFILDLGCGNKKTYNAIGIDRFKYPGVDIVADLNFYPWPIKSNSFDKIICRHILEHLDNVVKVMEEIYRISKPNAVIIIEVPHFSHPDAFRDPTHKHYFTFNSFDYFADNPMYPKYTQTRFKIIRKEFKATSGINRFLSSHINPLHYEERYARIFPAYGLYIEMVTLK